MANPSGQVKFAYVPTGSSLPATPDGSTVYYVEGDKQLYVGANPISNWGVVSIITSGTGNAITDASTSGGTVTLTKGTISASVSASTTGSGNVVTAVTAEGSAISVTKSSTAVLTSGAQTVAGIKTFSSFPVLPSSDPTSNYQAATKKYVDDKVQSITGPMVFKGTLGTGGTITALPTASASTIGYTYKVIVAGTYASQSAKVGDLFVCSDTPAWILIPSGDEPSGTVTNVATGTGLTGGPITSTGTISHADTSTQTSITNSGNTVIQSVGLDDFGHVTSLSSKSLSIPAAPGTLNTTATTAQSTASAEALSGSVTLHKVSKTGAFSDLIGAPTIVTSISGSSSDSEVPTAKAVNDAIGSSGGGTVTSVAISAANNSGLSVVSGSPITTTGTIAIAHADTSSQTSVTSQSRRYINSVTLDDFGHVTALGTGTETVTNTTYTFTNGTAGSFTVTPSGGTAQTVSIGKPATAGAADSATNATNATNDGSGNNIVNTYATKSELSWTIIS